MRHKPTLAIIIFTTLAASTAFADEQLAVTEKPAEPANSINVSPLVSSSETTP